ncbi:sensor histidine kinase [Sphaerisporangium krabiense]|uniref:histidine kinase n=1 Tax=Sphaerisporangium krabiense TaxID=763782 RepID=A0A7W9DRK5_9ACTN|nr:histidine kinase [Sphaerisporangium krabiense]MBB5628747.1 signal transduction histidine kinase [Sphaerisporangium krabiense]
MHVTPQLPLLKRVPPGAWAALAWCAGAVLTFLMRVRLPGEEEPAIRPGHLVYRWDGLSYLALATALALAGAVLLRRRPLPALALTLTASAVATLSLGVGEIPMAQFLAVDVVLYFIAATRSRRTGVFAVTVALTTLVCYVTVRLLLGWTIGTSAELAVALTAVIAWLAGDSMRQAREYAQRLSAQAAAQAVTGERLRIARELHDMVAHSIGIIALQAGAARRVIDTQPARVREALGEIETVGRDALAGLRRMVGALRQTDREPVASTLGRTDQTSAMSPLGRTDQTSAMLPLGRTYQTPARPPLGQTDPRSVERLTAPLSPAPGLAEVARLIATTTDAGVRVDVRWHGERRPLPPEIDISAYRIIQEALTNVIRHARTRTCLVSIAYHPEDLSIDVHNDAPDTPLSPNGHTAPDAATHGPGWHAGDTAPSAAGNEPPDHGYGLVGMRERVTLLRGEFSAGPCPQGGFRVTASLPAPAGVR